MKLLHFSLLLLSLEIIQTIALNTTKSNTKPIVEFRKLHYAGIYNLAKEFSVKYKYINREILKDSVVLQASTPEMKDFKRSMTYFKEIYPLYEHLNMSDKLVVSFSNMVYNYLYQQNSTNYDTQYISKLLDTFDYDRISDEYEERSVIYLKTVLLPQFESYRTNKKKTKFSRWIIKLNKCNDYNCFYNDLRKFYEDYVTPRKLLLENIESELFNLDVFYGNQAHHIAIGVLKDASLSQLDTNAKQQLTTNLRDFILNYESNRNYNRFHDILLFFHYNIVIRFWDNPQDFTKTDQKLLRKIFVKHNFKQFSLDYKQKLEYFMQQDFPNEFEHFRNSLNREQLAEEQDLLDWFNKFKRLESLSEQRKSFDELFRLFRS